jgi:hypothetical protein
MSALVVKRFFSVDEARQRLSEIANHPISDRDILDLARRDELSLCGYLSGNFGFYDNETNQWEFSLKFGHYLYFVGYVKVAAKNLVDASGFPKQIWSFTQFDAHTVAFEKQSPEQTQDCFKDFVGDTFPWGEKPQWVRAHFSSHHDSRGIDDATPGEIAFSRDDFLIPHSDILRLASRVEEDQSELPEGARESSNFHSAQLRYLMQASRKFWEHADRNDKSTHQSNSTVSAWLVQQGFSPTLARHAASIIRPEWADTGRPPEK